MRKIFILCLYLFVLNSLVYGEKIDTKNCKAKKIIVTGYYSPVKGQGFYYKGNLTAEKTLNGEGIRGASGIKVFNGMIAAPKSYKYGTIIYFPGYGVGKITDRGGAIVSSGLRGNKYDRIDIWMGYGEDGLKRALSFGKKELQAYICTNIKEIGFDFDKFLVYQNFFDASIWSMSLGPGRNDMWVKSLQKYLYKLGYLTEKDLTGYYGTRTKSAVCKYQQKYGLASSKELLCGYFGPKTRSHLKYKLMSLGYIKSNLYNQKSGISNNTPNNLIKSMFNQGFVLGEKHEKVKILQEKLILLGYYDSQITGEYDKKTAEAVYKLQVKNKIIKADENSKAQGYFGPKTRKTLMEELQNYEIEKQKKEEEDMMKKIALEKATEEANSKLQKEPSKILFSRAFQKGESGEEIKLLQEKLTLLGYYNSEIDGIFDQSTSNAIFEFQLNNKILTESDDIALRGYFGPQTRKTFNEKILEFEIAKKQKEEEEMKARLARISGFEFKKGYIVGERNEEIGILQEKLQILGYLEGDITNVYDQKTAEAVYKFQIKHGILKGNEDSSVMGYFGPQTRRVFNELLKQETIATNQKNG